MNRKSLKRRIKTIQKSIDATIIEDKLVRIVVKLEKAKTDKKPIASLIRRKNHLEKQLETVFLNQANTEEINSTIERMKENLSTSIHHTVLTQ
jgi:hypothetical protein